MKRDRTGRLSEDGGYLAALTRSTNTVHTLWPPAETQELNPEPQLGAHRCTKPPDQQAFYPHGVTSVRRSDRVLVYVVTHAGELGGREGIEIFELRGSGADTTLTWKACIPAQDGVYGNDVAVARNAEIVLSNYQPDASMWHAVRATLFGSDTGDLRIWNASEGWRVMPGTRSAMPNGVAVSLDGTTVFYTETIAGAVHRRPLASSRGAISVHIGGNPDNLTWTRRGTLLVAVHTDGAGLLLCQLGRSPCKTGWEVYEIDPTTMAASLVLRHDGTAIGAIATAAEIDDTLYLGSVLDDRIGAVVVDHSGNP
jgi:hypothetical protein